MKWYKHISDSGDDPDIDDAFTKFKANGNYVFWRTLEIMSREFDINNPGKNTFSVEFFGNKFRISFNKVIKILSFYQKRGRIYFDLCEDDGFKMIELNCPKLKLLTDEYTKKMMNKMSGQNQEKVESPLVRSKK